MKQFSTQRLQNIKAPNYAKCRPKVWTNNDNHYTQLRRDKLKETERQFDRLVRSGVYMNYDLDDLQKEEIAKLPLPREKDRLQILNEETNKKLTAALRDAKCEKLVEDGFSFSLSRCMDNNFQAMIRPGVSRYQTTHSPTNASNSKSQFLLRNTFSYEAYQEFLSMRR